jgi:predicted peroxiredoxin
MSDITDTTTTGTDAVENVTDPKKLVILLSRGIDDERATVGWTLANAGIASGQEVTVFLVSAGADVVRKGAADLVRMNPEDPSMRELIDNFMAGGGKVWVCPPCAALRAYTADSFIDGVEIVGAGPLHDQLTSGAATLCL